MSAYLANDSGTTESVWMGHVGRDRREQDRPALSADAVCDVCVVGAGIAGLSVAYRMAKEGKKVILLDDGPIAGGESGRTTAFLNTYADDGLSRIANKHDEETARKFVDSFRDAINFIENVCRDEGVDAHFERLSEYWFVDPQGDDQDFLDREMNLYRRLDWLEPHFADKAPVPGVDTGRCIVFPNQAKIHAGLYLSGLAEAAERHGATIHNNTHVSEVGDDGDMAAFAKTSTGHTVRCQWLVLCTNSPIDQALTDILQIHSRQSAWRTYAIGLRVNEGDVADAMFSDTAEPYHYVRVELIPDENGKDEPILIVGGEDVKVGHTGSDDEECFVRLENWARRHWPAAGERRYAWSGQVFEPDDYLASIGKDPGGSDRVLLYTGDSGQGITNGTLAAIVLGDLMLGRQSPYADMYDPARLSIKGLTTTAKEGLDVAMHYAADYLGPGEVKSVEEIAPGRGAVIRRGAAKYAVYRDEAGNLHECSAVCPHFGGIVHWNDMEKSWDCPIHGSRFAPDGRCITSPAIGPLKRASE